MNAINIALLKVIILHTHFKLSARWNDLQTDEWKGNVYCKRSVKKQLQIHIWKFTSQGPLFFNILPKNCEIVMTASKTHDNQMPLKEQVWYTPLECLRLSTGLGGIRVDRSLKLYVVCDCIVVVVCLSHVSSIYLYVCDLFLFPFCIIYLNVFHPKFFPGNQSDVHRQYHIFLDLSMNKNMY